MVKFFSSSEARKVLKVPNKTFLRITRYKERWIENETDHEQKRSRIAEWTLGSVDNHFPFSPPQTLSSVLHCNTMNFSFNWTMFDVFVMQGFTSVKCYITYGGKFFKSGVLDPPPLVVSFSQLIVQLSSYSLDK